MPLSGLDIGSTGCKLSVYGENGAYLGQVYRDYPIRRTSSSHELDASAIWEAVRDVLREAAGRWPDITGIGVTSFGETFVLLDAHDEPIFPSMLYTDPHGVDECAALESRLDPDWIVRTVGVRPSPMYSLPKLMWLKSHRPDGFARAAHIFQMQEYVVYMLTGVAQADYSLASRTMAFDIRAHKWCDGILDAAGIDARLFSRTVPIGTPAGDIKPEIAKELGLSAHTVVVSIGHDQVAAAIGSGVFDDTYTVDGAGTVECLTPVFKEYDSARMVVGNFAIVPYLDNSYVTYAFLYTGGALVQWYVNTLAGYAAASAKESGADVHTLLEQSYTGDPTGLLVLPHFAGAATPYMDVGSKGAILGLTLSTTQQDMYIAALEGVCYEMRLNQELLSAAGVTVKPLRATGGGARSKLWLQMKADILDVPVTALASSDAGSTGSAMFAGIATGLFADLKQAAKVMVVPSDTYLPRPDAHERYMAVYERYKQVYNAVRPLM